jgi:hypothetical protein
VFKAKAGWLSVIVSVAILGLGNAASAARPNTAAAPIPITSCETISAPGNYLVTANLTAASDSDCLVIAANGVGINLGKHTLTGSGANPGNGITDDGAGMNHIVIANGKITGFNNGVSLTSTGGVLYRSYVTIDNVNSSSNKGDGAELGSGGEYGHQLDFQQQRRRRTQDR